MDYLFEESLSLDDFKEIFGILLNSFWKPVYVLLQYHGLLQYHVKLDYIGL